MDTRKGSIDSRADAPDRATPKRVSPAVAPALGLIGGIALDAYLCVPHFWHYVFAIGGAAQLIVGRRRPGARQAGLLLVAAACGMALHDASFRRVEADHLATLCSGQPIRVRVRGVVVQPARITRPAEGPFGTPGRDEYRTQLLIRCEAIESASGWQALSGLVPLRISGVFQGAGPGDWVEAFGRLVPNRPSTNPGQTDWGRINRRGGVFASLRCGHPEAVRAIASDANLNWLHAIRTRIRLLLVPDVLPMDDESASVAEAMVLGRRSEVSPTLNEAFARTGTSHYLSASGLHVGILGGFVWLVASVIGVQRRARAVIVLLVVVMYAGLAEPRVPIFRAAVLAALFCISVMFHRSAHTLNWIAVSAVVILVWRPTELFSPGFQLSFVVLLGIIYVTPQLVAIFRQFFARRTLEARLRVVPPRSQWRRLAGGVGKGVGYSVAVSVAAWLSALLPLAWHFHQIPTWGWLSSLLLMPIAFAVMIVGFLRIVAGAVWPLLGVWMGPVLEFLVGGLTGAVSWMATWPVASIAVPPPSMLVTVAAGGAVYYLVQLSRAPGAVSRKRRLLQRANVMLCVGVILLTLVFPVPSAPEGVVVDVLDVGDGSATIVRLPDNRTLLYDAGSRTLADAGRSVVVPALLAERVGRIDAAFISHANTDHFNGMPSVAQAFSIRAALISTYPTGQEPKSFSTRGMLEWLGRSEIPTYALVSGDVLELGPDVRVRVLWPPPAETGMRLSANDSSLVLRIEHGGRSVLLCGDIEVAGQQHLLDGGGLGSDVLVLPHHGAVVANTAEFIAAVAPTVIVRSSGQESDRTHSALRALIGERAYFNTADVGAVRIELTEGRVAVAAIVDQSPECR